MITIEELRELNHEETIRYTAHALDRMVERDISTDDVMHGIETGTIVEQYPEDFPFPSCLVLGVTIRNSFVHIVVALEDDSLIIITAYYPDAEKWEPGYMKRRCRE